MFSDKNLERYKNIQSLYGEGMYRNPDIAAPETFEVPMNRQFVEILLTTFGRKKQQKALDALYAHFCSTEPADVEDTLVSTIKFQEERMPIYYDVLLNTSMLFEEDSKPNELWCEVVLFFMQPPETTYDHFRKLAISFFVEGKPQKIVANELGTAQPNISRQIKTFKTAVEKMKYLNAALKLAYPSK